MPTYAVMGKKQEYEIRRYEEFLNDQPCIPA